MAQVYRYKGLPLLMLIKMWKEMAYVKQLYKQLQQYLLADFLYFPLFNLTKGQRRELMRHYQKTDK